MTEHQEKKRGPFTRNEGFWIVILCHLLWIVFPLADMGLVVVQLVYVLPLAIYFHVKKETAAAQGVWLAAGVSILLTAGAWGFCFLIMENMSFH